MKARAPLLIGIFIISFAGCRRKADPGWSQPLVSVYEIPKGQRVGQLEVEAVATPAQQVEIAAPFAGVVKGKARTDPQGLCAKGETLLEVRSSETELRLEQARERLAIAEKELDRQRRALALGFVAAKELPIYETAVVDARTDVQVGEAQIARSAIRAPFEGRVEWLPVAIEGRDVMAGEILCRVFRGDLWKATAKAGSDALARLDRSAVWSIVSADAPTPIPATLAESTPDPLVPGARMVSVTFKPTASLAPGQRVILRADMAVTVGGALIPEECVTYVNRVPHVFIVERRMPGSTWGTARLREVVLGIEEGSMVSVVSGLAAGDCVVRGNLSNVSPDLYVRVSAK